MDKRGVLYVGVISAAVALVAGALAIGQPRPPVRGPGGDPGRSPVGSFVNFETAQVHPVDMTPDGTRLLVCNTADARLMVFDLSAGGSGIPQLAFEVPVGIDPISVRARTNAEAWVVNNISDTVSVVNLQTRTVTATLKTRDEPSDVVFAGSPQRAFITCSQAAVVMVFDPANLAAPPQEIPINGIDPRALAVSPDGQTVYAAIFNSGNGSTVLGGGIAAGNTLAFPPNVVSHPSGPYGGVNPPPNSGASFDPPIAPANQSTVPRVSLIVKKDEQGRWMDDNGGDWTDLVSGPSAALSGRLPGWNLPDRDLAVINAGTLSVSYATRLMNICMAVGVNPASGEIAVVGTDAINEVRFEPVVNGIFARVNIALVNPATLAGSIADLNPHLTYTTHTIPQSERSKSIGDPRAVVFNSAGTRGYITGMGSNNIIVVDSAGQRAGLAPTIDVGEGPTGLALDEARARLYVLNRFEGSISVVGTDTESVLATIPFFDPTPPAIKLGRKHLYDTHKTSGLGHVSCATCHVDARMDRLAWDLGDPSGAIKGLAGLNLGAGIPGLTTGFAPFHPMKGPMTTQTLQDIIGKEPHHWRGDRLGIEEFNGAFVGLLGDDAGLSPQEMQEFEDFLATIHFPPNPFRNFDNSLPQTLPLPGQYTTGRFGPAGQPLPVGRPNIGLALYRDTNRRLDNGAFACVTCHTLPTGAGTDTTLNVQTQQYVPIPPGPNGERHLQVVSVDGTTNVTIKTPQLRNAYQKVGFELTQLENNAGFGFLHDGSVDSLARFVSEPVFTVQSDQEVADLVAFMMCLSGSDLPNGGNVLQPPGVLSKDAHAAVGAQTTLVSLSTAPPAQLNLINQMQSQAALGRVGLIVKGVVGGVQRGFAFVAATGQFQSDMASQVLSPAALLALAQPGSELTFMVVPAGLQTRMGIDRDENGIYDGDEPGACYANCDGSTTPPVLNIADFSCFLQKFAAGDPYANCDWSIMPPALNIADFACFLQKFAAGCP
jgi:YVTN family beta-propeller protein